MKQLSFISFFCGLLFTASFVAAQGFFPDLINDFDDEEGDCYNWKILSMEQIWPLDRVDTSYFDGKLIIAFNMGSLNIPIEIIDRQDKLRAQNAMSMIQNLNKLQKQGMSSGQFAVIGLNCREDHMLFLEQCRPMFPVYEDSSLEKNEIFSIIASSGHPLESYKNAKQLLAGIKRYTTAESNMKRMKRMAVPHPLAKMKLSLKNYEILSVFEPGKPWNEPYKKLENAIAKSSNNSKIKFMEKIKAAIDSYLLNTVPEICEKAKERPAASYEKLVLLSKSIKGMPGEELVKNALTPLQGDKNIVELAKIISAIDRFKTTEDSLKGFKKKVEPQILSIKKFLEKPDLTNELKVEAVEAVEQYVNFLPDDEVSPGLKNFYRSAMLMVKKELPKETNDDDAADSEDDVSDGADNADKKTEKVAGKRLVKKIKGVEFAFRYCPPGSFIMGAPLNEEDRKEDETQHKVTLTKGFWMMETEVSQKQWEAVMENNPSYFKGDDLPVERVSWKECQEFCKRCTLFGVPLNLPTEAQWEYACRAGTTGAFAGDLDEMAWYNGNCNKTQAVGTAKPNKWGLYDMHGNVYEWCEDYYALYPKAAETNPTGPVRGEERVCRGGAWGEYPAWCRSARRDQAESGGNALGFRCVINE